MNYTNDNKDLIIIDPLQDTHILKGLASDIRISILHCLQKESLNINEISTALNLPQSTVATNVLTLEDCGLIQSQLVRASKGNQKVCQAVYKEFLVRFQEEPVQSNDVIEVEMPIGLYIQSDVSSPCGLCSSNKIIGYLDSPKSFLEPARSKAELLWFEKGKVKYQFPNNALNQKKEVKKLELLVELSSETPGTNLEWPSDITLNINSRDIGFWTSPGDFGDKRGKYTPDWWKLEGSQYGILTTWTVSEKGSFVNGTKISDICINDLCLMEHHSIKVAFEIKDDAENIGGINIFGKGFGNYDHDILLILSF